MTIPGHHATRLAGPVTEGVPVAPNGQGGQTMSIVAMLAAAGAVVGLWVGATRHTGPVARGYRWLGGAALFWCAGLIVDTVVAGSVTSSGEPLGLADVAPLLGLAAAATGIMV